MSYGNLCPTCKTGTLLPNKFVKGTFYCSNYKAATPCKYRSKLAVKTTTVGNVIPVCTTLSKEQSDILEVLKTSDSNVIVEALAGTGKTFTMTQSVRVLTDRKLSVLCLAFAKRDQLAMTERVAGRCQVKTSNGAGYSILNDYMKVTGGGKLNCEKDIAKQILEAQLVKEGLIVTSGKEREYKIKYTVIASAIELVEKARNVLPLQHPQKPTEQQYVELMVRFGIEIQSEQMADVLSWAAWLFVEMANLKNLKVWGTDFTGQIFLPSYHNLYPVQRFDRVLVDEAQDQSYATRRIAELHCKANVGRIVAVGDKNQAIYGWRGADSDALEEMAKLMTENGGVPIRLPLTECRRCPKSVIEYAQMIVPEIVALDDAKDGEVSFLPNEDDFVKELIKTKKGLVLCRANAPSVSMAMKLLANGVPAALVRSDIVHQLLKLIDKCSGNDAKTLVGDMLSCVNNWAEEQFIKIAKMRNAERMAELIRDKVAVIETLSLNDDVNTVGDLKRLIDRLFPSYVTNKKGEQVQSNEVEMGERSESLVLFSTVHGAKGGEADTVYMYSPTQKNGGSLWDAIWDDVTDRNNVVYVSLTRSKNRLIFAGVPPTLSRDLLS